MDLLQTVASTDDPSFASDSKGRILAWNRGASRLLGHCSSEVRGKRCFDVLEGRDRFGNRFCHEHCAIRSMAVRHEPVHHCQLSFRKGSGERLAVSMSVFYLRGERRSEFALVHLLEPIALKARDGSPLGNPVPEASDCEAPSKSPRPDPSLTVRETEVLRMLAAGATTLEIAHRLSISNATVRNHTHHILSKLNARHRLEAVCIAMRSRLL